MDERFETKKSNRPSRLYKPIEVPSMDERFETLIESFLSGISS